jgi:hypothetical protein
VDYPFVACESINRLIKGATPKKSCGYPDSTMKAVFELINENTEICQRLAVRLDAQHLLDSIGNETSSLTNKTLGLY